MIVYAVDVFGWGTKDLVLSYNEPFFDRIGYYFWLN
jgi:hypothetical protein